MTSENIIEFKKELKILLQKYNVTIDLVAHDCSDWHGIIEERISICDKNTGKELERLVNGSSMSASDIK